MLAKTASLQRFWIIVAIFLISLVVVACGRGQSGGDTSASAAPTAPPLPVPTKNFVAVGQLTVLTNTTTVSETAQTTQTSQSAAAGGDLKRGETAYTKNKCGDCHGAKGEGVPDKGGPVVGTTITFEEFDKVLRTGGGLGNTHIFGRSAVSPSGMEALYAYVLSLGQ